MLQFIKNTLKPHIKATPMGGCPPYGFFSQGKASWDEVEAMARGYSADAIFNKVKNSLEQVRDRQAVYERDSVIFDEIQYAWPLLACLEKIIIQEGRLDVVDFGGSLGSSYFQNRDFLKPAKINWSVIEQPHFVREGKAHFTDSSLQFFSTIEEALKSNPQNKVLLVSSTIQYLPAPFEALKSWVELPFKYIIFDRTTFYSRPENVITLQKVPPSIYDAEYPAWFLNEEQFLAFFASDYEKMSGWDALGGTIPIYGTDGSKELGYDKGMFFRAKEI